MSIKHQMRLEMRLVGDTAFTIVFDELEGAAGARAIRQMCDRLGRAQATGRFPEVVDLIPATRSLTVCLEPGVTDEDALKDDLLSVAMADDDDTGSEIRLWELPACYDMSPGSQWSPDLIEVSEQIGLSVEDIIACHSGELYDVLLIGFLPGFPFLGTLPEALRLPRRKSPRTRVPPGSIAMANDQTAIYPWESPGGWHLLARCPVPLFDAGWKSPCLLSPGDKVRFIPTSVEDLQTITAELLSGNMMAQDFAQPCEGFD
ncbi:MAG: 5-oxoprolinase subunit PxpB [Magnetovibrionaceae bacterium]